MTNNDILKKLRVALQLRDEQIVEVLALVDFRISKGEINNFFRNEDHPKYVECQDQILRNFLNGLVIYLRGTKENPKSPKDTLKKIEASKIKLSDKPSTKSDKIIIKEKKSKIESLPSNIKLSSKDKNTKLIKQDILKGTKFNNGKSKK